MSNATELDWAYKLVSLAARVQAERVDHVSEKAAAMKAKRVLYVVECRMAETGEWRIYGGEPYAFTTRSKADKVRLDAKRFNRSKNLKWIFRVIPYVPRGGVKT